jgi:hypothetical protein
MSFAKDTLCKRFSIRSSSLSVIIATLRVGDLSPTDMPNQPQKLVEPDNIFSKNILKQFGLASYSKSVSQNEGDNKDRSVTSTS